MNGTDGKGAKACFNFRLFRSLRLFRILSPLCLLFALSQSPAAQTQDQRININTASVEELAQLPGIGPGYAANIVAYRQKHGRFKRPQDIIVVKGMSAGHYRRIAALIRI